MSIGTAAPNNEQLSEIRHHFVGSIPVDQYFNASIFEEQVMDLTGELFLRNKRVIMVGGSGLYLDAVMYGIDELPTVDMALRQQVKERYEEIGLRGLQEWLKELDPIHYETVDLNNPKRILKAIEISLMTGQPYSSFLTHSRKMRPFKMTLLGLEMDRKELYLRINRRVDRMMEDGLLKEVSSLVSYRHCNALKTVGYKELFEYLDGSVSLAEAIEKIKSNSRKYARKQITWFRKYNDVRWFHPGELNEMIRYVAEKTGNE
jgi:tRNA dimethylallyltransferase